MNDWEERDKSMEEISARIATGEEG